MVRVEEIDAVRTLDRAAAVLDDAPSVAGHMHARAERVVARIGGNRPVARQDTPWEKDFERDSPWAGEAVAGEQTRFGHAGLGSAGGEAGVGFAPAVAFGDIPVPEIELEVFPTPPFPLATRLAGAVGRGVDFTDLRAGAA